MTKLKVEVQKNCSSDTTESSETLKTPEDYRKALSKMKANIVKDKLVRDPCTDKELDKGINVVSVSYEYANDPKMKDFMTAKSPLTGKTVHRYNYIPQSKEDLEKRYEMINTLAKETFCAQRCVGSDALYALFMGTFLVDQDKTLKTDYHPRFLEYLKYVQENDIAPAGAITDAKGDRSIAPSDQPERDSYVHVVEKTEKGVYVSGIKSPITMGPYAEEICVLPGRQFASHEKDFAIAFAVPADAEGITRFVLSPEVKALEGEFSACHGKKYLNKEAMIVFENVFVPWERVFLCGEYQYTGRYADFFATVHRFSYCACKPAVFDLLSGAAALISEYNGTEGKYLFSDSKGKLFEILKNSDMIKGMGQAAIKFAKETESGAVLPDPKYANLGKFISGEQFPKAISILQDMAGNLPVSLPHENLLQDKEYGPKVKKVFARKEGVSPEDHYRLNELIRTIAASDEGGLLQFGTRHGGGTVEVEKATIYTQSLKKLQECKKAARRQAGIE